MGQKTFFDALEYCCSKTFKGACSGEVIAGVEPIEDTLRAVDMITSMGALPTVCIFRPVIGADMEGYPSPHIKQPSYNIGDLRFGFDHDKWSLQLYVSNITDERAVLFANPYEFDYYYDRSRVTVNRPRQFGIRWIQRFGG